MRVQLIETVAWPPLEKHKFVPVNLPHFLDNPVRADVADYDLRLGRIVWHEFLPRMFHLRFALFDGPVQQPLDAEITIKKLARGFRARALKWIKFVEIVREFLDTLVHQGSIDFRRVLKRRWPYETGR